MIKRFFNRCCVIIGRFWRNAHLIFPLVKRVVQSPREFLREIKHFALAKNVSADLHAQIQAAAKVILPASEPLNLQVSPDLEGKPYLNVVLPGLAVEYMSGGPNTIVNLAYRMAAKGVPIRLISAIDPIGKDPEPILRHIQNLTGIQERFSHVQMVCGVDRKRPLYIGVNDTFMATAWQTAQMVKSGLELTRSKKFMYVIQDFEPGFYPWSAEQLLSLETYSMNYCAVVNSQLLADYYVGNRIGRFGEESFRDDYVVLPTAVDSSKFYFEKNRPKGAKRRLLFYWRPTAAKRNLFHLGLSALSEAGRRGIINPSEYELYFMGEEYKPVSIYGGNKIVSLPWLSYDEYAEQLRGADIVLSLMLSPHSSYPPLEAAACGALAVTNTYDCKTAGRLREISSNIIAAEPTLEGLVEGLRGAVKAASDLESRRASSKLNLPSSWEEAFGSVVPRAIEMWKRCSS